MENPGPGPRNFPESRTNLNPDDQGLVLMSHKLCDITKWSRAVTCFLVSKIMAKVVEEEGTDLVIVGKQSIDGDYGQTAQMLATQLDWAQGTSLYSVSTQILELLVFQF